MSVVGEHISVMPRELLEWISPLPKGKYVDATLGLGGHTELLLTATGGKAYVLGLDRDSMALEKAADRLGCFASQISYYHGSFRNIHSALEEVNWDLVDGVIADLGVSSMQLDTSDRGFSFLQDGPLDMRMDQTSSLPSAASIVNSAPYARLRDIIWKYGEEPMAGRIARAIIAAREEAAINSTLELARIVASAYPAKRRAMARNHPATKTFQALRIEVNRELEEIEEFIAAIVDRIRPGGRIAIISFHSLEDRIVKQMFKRESQECLCPREYPECQCGHHKKLKILTKKPLIPSDEEQRSNSRSRSAKLRVAERLPVENA